jgi:hypothetical protein
MRMLLLLAVFVLIGVADSSACEGCANLEATSTGQSVKMVQAGFSWSVLFLLGVPMLLMGFMFRLMVRACRDANLRG